LETAATHPHIRSRTSNSQLLEEKRAAIGRAATRCFSRRGYPNTTVEAIAHEAGMSVGSIYRFVQRKEDILLLVIAQVLDLYESRLIPIVKLPLPPTEKLRQAMLAYYGIIDHDPRRAQIAYRESRALTKAGREYIKQREIETNRHIERIIQEGIDQRVFRPVDPNLVTYDIVLLGHMWALKAWHFRKLMTCEEYVARQYDFVMASLCAARSYSEGREAVMEPEVGSPQYQPLPSKNNSVLERAQ
jgi:AcrR family transcriptional regulator